MTAEIAILNKTAVALAADSAVTISAGTEQQKIFDSADKLFELTCNDAIGVMVNNDMNFMETPLPVIIKKYRNDAPRFTHVKEAAQHFLQYLDNFARESPQSVKDQALRLTVMPLLQQIEKRAREAFMERIFKPEGGLREEVEGRIAAVGEEAMQEQLMVMQRAIDRQPDANFVGEEPLSLSNHDIDVLKAVTQDELQVATSEQQDIAVEICQAMLRKRVSNSATGIVVAGFGSEELFPTLVSFEIYGVVGERLKFAETNFVDVDRDGTRARVLPFAQREMVERFLYGLDETIQRQITTFCKQSVPQISAEILSTLEMKDEDREALAGDVQRAEAAFFKNLEEESFQAIRSQSRGEIEDMVEFMPKPEMARMAEALVNLTSIKRRVSRGFETVGGPIDVAVISAAEGFVWVKRKHYFPGELNSRYFARTRTD